MVEFDLSKITGREPPLKTDDDLPCACEWNAAGEPVGLCAAHQSKLDDELAALRERVAELEADATRYRWLTADLNRPERTKRNEILGRMAVLSHSAASRDIDAAMQTYASAGGG